MTMRNVSLVFGPTLVRHPDNAEGDELSNMSAGYVIVEMLCKHVSYGILCCFSVNYTVHVYSSYQITNQ